jgi:hypothetical protein
MVNFLDNEGEAPRTFSTAISVIERTLEMLEGMTLRQTQS